MQYKYYYYRLFVCLKNIYNINIIIITVYLFVQNIYNINIIITIYLFV